MAEWQEPTNIDTFFKRWYTLHILNGVGDQMICKSDITSLKTDIFEKVGQKIKVKGSLGRSKFFEKEATLEKAYPNIFVVRYEENDRNVTYSYTDVLTRTVELDVFNGEEYSPLIPPTIEQKIASRTV